MSDLTSELNLAQCVDDDDTADYLTTALSDSLNTVDGLFSSSTGHTHFGSHNGAPIDPASFPDGSIPGAKLIDGSVTSVKLAGPETLYVGSWVNTAVNYTVASTVMYVFCTAAVAVTLPVANGTNRPITVIAVTGQSTVTAAGGTVIGGTANTTTGAVQNGVVAAGESFTYKSDGTDWRAV